MSINTAITSPNLVTTQSNLKVNTNDCHQSSSCAVFPAAKKIMDCLKENPIWKQVEAEPLIVKRFEELANAFADKTILSKEHVIHCINMKPANTFWHLLTDGIAKTFFTSYFEGICKANGSPPGSPGFGKKFECQFPEQDKIVKALVAANGQTNSLDIEVIKTLAKQFHLMSYRTEADMTRDLSKKFTDKVQANLNDYLWVVGAMTNLSRPKVPSPLLLPPSGRAISTRVRSVSSATRDASDTFKASVDFKLKEIDKASVHSRTLSAPLNNGVQARPPMTTEKKKSNGVSNLIYKAVATRVEISRNRAMTH